LREGKGDIAMLGNILKVTVDSVEAPGVKGLAVEGSGLQGLGGRTLFEAVFCTEELKRWYEELEGPLLIEADAELQEVKWEMMHDGEGFMALSRGMARVLDTPDRSRRGEREGGRLEVLVALASPVLDLRLADPHEERQPHVLDLEDRAEIFAGLEGHDFAAEFRVLRHVTRVRLDEELSREADVLHLTAHGQRGRVALEDRAWRLEEARADELAADAARGGVSLAVLESCLSAAAEPEGGPSTALAMLEGGVPMVVGMTEAVWVEAAKAFTQSLYRLLAQGHDVVQAVRLARRNTELLAQGHDVVQAVRLARRNTEAACRRESGASEDWKLPCLYLSKQVLLVLDNLEPFGEEGLVMPLLRALGGRCRVLATSRHELPGAEIECVDVTALAPSEAVEMVWREAAAKPVEIVQAGRLAQACRYTPMAIRLAVGRIASPRETEEQVIGAFEEFAGGTEDLVRYAFEGALGAADEETRLVFACAALFVQPPRREALAAATGLDEEGLGRGIAEAVRLSLLEPVGERDRFELLPLARRVAERELKKLTDVEQRRRRAAEECVGFVARMGALIRADMMGQSLGQRGPERRDGVVFTGVELAADAQRAGISQLEQEWASAVEFARCAFEAGEWKLVPGFSEGVGPFLTLRGMYGEYLELGPMALEAARKGGCRKAETVELNNMGNVHQQQGRYEEAMGLYEQSLEIFRELGDQRGEGQALGNMGLVHEQQGQYDEAMRLYERSLWVFREVGASDGERRTLGNMAIVHCHQGRYEEAIDLCAQNLEICRKLADRRGEGAVLNTMAEVARRQGRYSEAMALYEKGLEIAQQLGDRNMESATLNNMAIVHSEHGRHDEAMELYERTLEISEDVGDRDGRARALVNMGAVHEQRGGYDETMRLYEQGLEIFRELGDREGEGQALYDMAIVHQWQGRYEQAMGLYEQSLEICRELGDGRGECQRLNNMAVVHVQEGRLDEALGAFEQSLEICRELGDGHGEGQTLNNMAGVHQLQGRYEEAMGLYEQSLAIRRELGDRLGEGQTLMNMGVLAENSGNADKAREHWQEALEALEGLGVPEEEQVRELLEELGDGQ